VSRLNRLLGRPIVIIVVGGADDGLVVADCTALHCATVNTLRKSNDRFKCDLMGLYAV
jgi:hypothetical protein